MPELRIPAALRDADSDGSRADWLARLPDVVADLTARWSLAIDDPYEPGGHCAWVAPARRAGGEVVVLKVGWPHPESQSEAEGLAFWNGDGTIRLIDSVTLGGSEALLLERCLPGTTLTQSCEPEGRDVVVAGLLKRLRREPPPGHAFRPLQQMCDEWVADAAQSLLASPAFDLGVIRAGLSLFTTLPASAPQEVVLLTDLHADNVLAAEREPWLAIDPKPYVGDPTYDALQHMLNVPRLHRDPAGLIARMADLAGLDTERLRLWLFARCAVGAVDDPDLYAVAERLAP